MAEKSCVLGLFWKFTAFAFTCYFISKSISFLDATQFNYLDFYHNSAIVGGFLSGSLHALTGADHMAALLPVIAGKRWWSGGMVGVIWGSGHGLTSSVIGFFGYAMKTKMINFNYFFESYRFIIDSAVGLTLIVIGCIGIYEGHASTGESLAPAIESSDTKIITSTESSLEISADIADIEQGKDAESSSNQSLGMKKVATLVSVFMNGAVLGVSWDGLPSLAPSVVLEMWSLLFWFLMSYFIGTILTMGFAAAVVSEATCWLSKISGSEIGIADRLAHLSSYVACGIGVCWVVSAIVKYNNLEINNDNFNWVYSPRFHMMSQLFLCIGSVGAVVGVIVWSTYGQIMLPELSVVAQRVHFSLSRLSLADDKKLSAYMV
jgi:hypothetical protein